MRFQQRIGKVKEFADDCCGRDAYASLLEGCEAYASSGIYRSNASPSISDRHLLSARGSEVLFYLAKGFNAQYLQEKLFISEGTAKTHIRHIYGKMNVHSQQELMRIVNEVYVDD